MSLQQRIFARLYRRAATPDALPWHRDEPPALLERAVAERQLGDRALDIGCGTGVNAVYLARHGLCVVGVDFVPDPLESARARAEAAGVGLELVQSDILDYSPSDGFDLILDSGCLHHLRAGKVADYGSRLQRWLNPGGDYVLVHFTKRHTLDWQPVGRHVSRDKITRAFSWLRLEDYDQTVYPLSFPMGPTLAGIYWFRRPEGRT